MKQGPIKVLKQEMMVLQLSSVRKSLHWHVILLDAEVEIFLQNFAAMPLFHYFLLTTSLNKLINK